MIRSVEFQNFKVLRDTALPLGPFTLIVGPNGSGKTTALESFRIFWNSDSVIFSEIAAAGLEKGDSVSLSLNWDAPFQGVKTDLVFGGGGHGIVHHKTREDTGLPNNEIQLLQGRLAGIRLYSLDARAIARPVGLRPNIELGEDGSSLAGVLDQLRDHYPERFEALNEELGRWLPEFDRILFETPESGNRSVLLRTREGKHEIRAVDLSQGILIALAILTLAYVSDPPPMVCIEEPDRGIHPRLLREVRDALYRLSYPESFGEKRKPVQVVATTHSPYFLDLFKDHPEEIVIAHRAGIEAHFERLSDREDLEEILEGAHLGDIWYSGILGGVPSEK